MSSINNVSASMGPAYSAPVASPDTAPVATGYSYGNAVNISITQNQSSDGSDSYDVSVYGSGAGGGSLGRSASGSTAQGAFETLMSSLSGLGDKNQTGTAANDLQDQFNWLDAQITPGTGTGTITSSRGLTSSSASVTANISPTGQVTGADVHTGVSPEQAAEQLNAEIVSFMQDPVNRMTEGQTETYINTVMQSL